MIKKTEYTAKPVDLHGFVKYSKEDDAIWGTLFERQSRIVQHRGCNEYLEGLELLKFAPDRVPQLPDVNKILMQKTGWQVAPVAALIGFEEFFNLLAHRKFPAATFIRCSEELDYLQEPDIFHELFGHCPMLTNLHYADFMQHYGVLGLKASHEQRVMLARLYWFTVEFGLINTREGLRIYGGGILSSMSETPYSLESPVPVRKKLDPLAAFRTPYRIDIFQTVYYIINDFKDLYELTKLDLFTLIQEAKILGMFPPTFPPKPKDAEEKKGIY